MKRVAESEQGNRNRQVGTGPVLTGSGNRRRLFDHMVHLLQGHREARRHAQHGGMRPVAPLSGLYDMSFFKQFDQRMKRSRCVILGRNQEMRVAKSAEGTVRGNSRV